MKVRQLMTSPVLSVAPGETVEVAARTMTQYNIGALPVCGADGVLCGMITDRDLVTRCMAAQRPVNATRVREIMTTDVSCASADMDASVAAHLMGRQQVRRLPVVDAGKVCGMLTLADLARREDSIQDAADALGDISENIR